MTEMFDDFFGEITPKEVASKNDLKKVKSNADEKEDTKKQKNSDSGNKETVKEFVYPFILHFGGENKNIDHIFEEGKTYSEKQIKDAMMQHQFYEFSGEVSFDYFKEDNVLVPTFKHHKKG